MQQVFTFFDPDGEDLAAQLVPLWADSWQAQGWVPRLLTIRDARKNPRFNESDSPALLALEYFSGGWYCPTNVINVCMRPKQLRARHEFFIGGVLWATRLGAREILDNPKLSRRPGSNLVSAFGIDPPLPLVSFSECETLEDVQRGLASLSHAP